MISYHSCDRNPPEVSAHRLGGLDGLLRAFLHLLRSTIYLVCCNSPKMPIGILEEARAISVELIRNRFQDFPSLLGCFFDDGVAVRHIDIEAHRRGSNALGAALTHRRIFVSQHNARIATLYFGGADLAVRTIHSHNYGGAENVLVVLNRFRGTLNNKVWRNRIVAFGNVINFAHDFL